MLAQRLSAWVERWLLANALALHFDILDKAFCSACVIASDIKTNLFKVAFSGV
jgi:pentose-5-phosphate-3-epimerase